MRRIVGNSMLYAYHEERVQWWRRIHRLGRKMNKRHRVSDIDKNVADGGQTQYWVFDVEGTNFEGWIVRRSHDLSYVCFGVSLFNDLVFVDNIDTEQRRHSWIVHDSGK